MKRLTLDGVIASAAFASGDRIVVGAWRTGPLGPMNDVMWVNADNRRVLIAPSQQVAEFVTAIYEFDDVEVEPVYVGHTSRSFVVAAGRLHMQLKLGRAWPLPPLVARPPLVTRYVEGPVARRLMNVHTHGVTASGRRGVVPRSTRGVGAFGKRVN